MMFKWKTKNKVKVICIAITKTKFSIAIDYHISFKINVKQTGAVLLPHRLLKNCSMHNKSAIQDE